MVRKIRDSRLNLIFIGRSGSGKGTQAELMKKFLEEHHGEGSVFSIYPGEHFRQLILNHPIIETSKFLDEKMVKAGNKSPDFLTIWIWAQELIFNLKANQHLVFDGSPRTLLEAKILDEVFDFFDRKEVKPVLIDTSPEEAKKRMLKRGRKDDSEEQIHNRLAYYEKHVIPVIEYYLNESGNKLTMIDGNSRDPILIHKNILQVLDLK